MSIKIVSVCLSTRFIRMLRSLPILLAALALGKDDLRNNIFRSVARTLSVRLFYLKLVRGVRATLKHNTGCTQQTQNNIVINVDLRICLCLNCEFYLSIHRHLPEVWTFF